LSVIDIAIDNGTVVKVCQIGGTVSLDKFASSDGGARAKITDVKVRASTVLIDASKDIIASINGTVVVVFTEEDRSGDTAKDLIADSVGTH
jgi:hypothetical protein